LAIAAVQKDDEIEVEVADLGPDFRRKIWKRFFEMYYRGGEDIAGKVTAWGLPSAAPSSRPTRPDLGGKPHRRGGAAIRFTFPWKDQDQQ